MNTNTVLPNPPVSNAFCAAAQDYLERGWYPIPLDRPRRGDEKSGKRPLTKNWTALRLSADEARDTWGVDSPPNLGLLCGAPSRLVVLDFDDPDVFYEWYNTHPGVWDTYAVARDNAPRGRVHLYFSLPDGQAAPPSRSGKRWDFLSDGRQVVAPPSCHHTGGNYRSFHDVPLLPWSDEYLPGTAAQLPPQTADTTVEAPSPGTGGPAGRAGGEAYARAALTNEAGDVAATAEGGRNNRLNVAALKIGQLVGAGLLSAAEVEATLLAAAIAAGLPEAEATATISSGLQAGVRQPRVVPPAAGKSEPDPEAGKMLVPAPPEPWENPAPLGVPTGSLPPWPWEAMPRVLRDMGQAVAETIGVHDSMAAAAVLGCASIAAGNRLELTIKAGHTCRANLYILVAASVGSGKTGASRPCVAPLHAWESARLPAFKDALARWKAGDEVREASKIALRRKATSQKADTEAIAAELAELEARAGDPPAEPRLFVEDATSEALGRRLVDNRERMGVISSEGRKVLQIARGRYLDGRGSDLDLWLKAHAGDPHRVDRQGRPPYDLRSPCLSALLFTQPDALGSLGEDVETRESGFLARILYIVTPDGGAGDYPRDTVSEAVAAEYNRVIQAILDIDYVVDGKPVPVRAILTPDAFEHFASWYRDCGADLNVCAQQGYTFLATWLGKLREHVARLALLFAVVEAVETGAPLASPIQVTLAHLTAAAVVCEHLKLHARRAGIIVGETEEMAAARRVWRWLAVNGAKLRSAREAEGCGAVHAAKVRDLLRAGLPGCTTSKAAGLILVELAARGYVQKVDWQIPGGPKRLHELWFVHPTARR